MRKVFLFLILLLCVACGTEETERVTFTKATSHCNDSLLVTVPLRLLEKAVIADIEWQCEETVNDSLVKINYIVYHIYLPGGFTWCVNEDPRKYLAER